MGAMAENKANDPYPTGTYVKGDQTRVADTAADAVQAVFDGFTRVQEDSDVANGFAAVNGNDPQHVERQSDEEFDVDFDEDPDADES